MTPGKIFTSTSFGEDVVQSNMLQLNIFSLHNVFYICHFFVLCVIQHVSSIIKLHIYVNDTTLYSTTFDF